MTRGIDRIGYKRINARTGREVDSDNIVTGLEADQFFDLLSRNQAVPILL